MGGVIGLDYQSVYIVLSVNKVKNKKKIFRKIQLIEHGALTELNKK